MRESLLHDSELGAGSTRVARLAVGQAPGGRSSFAFDDYAGQADEYLGKAVPRRNGVKQIGAGALPSQVNFNDGSSTPLDAVQPRVPVKEYVQPPGGRASTEGGVQAREVAAGRGGGRRRERRSRRGRVAAVSAHLWAASRAGWP